MNASKRILLIALVLLTLNVCAMLAMRRNTAASQPPVAAEAPAAPAPAATPMTVPSNAPPRYPTTGWDREKSEAFDQKVLENEPACGWKGVNWAKDAASAVEESKKTGKPILGIVHIVSTYAGSNVVQL